MEIAIGITLFLIWILVGFFAGVYDITDSKDVTTKDLPLLILLSLFGLMTLFFVIDEYYIYPKIKNKILFKKRLK